MKQLNRKAQAATEFIMTYGWAILVVLIAIGALAYFGVLSPAKLLPDKCTATAGFQCTDFTFSTSLGGRIKLTNGLGSTVNVLSGATQTKFTVLGVGTACATGIVPDLGTATSWIAGAPATFSTGACAFTAGDKARGTLEIVYYTGADSSFTHTATIEVSATVQP